MYDVLSSRKAMPRRPMNRSHSLTPYVHFGMTSGVPAQGLGHKASHRAKWPDYINSPPPESRTTELLTAI